jgi:cytochrome b involved in lipid metabolism
LTVLILVGRDATEAFESIGHSEDARQLLESFYIGDLGAESKSGSAEKEAMKVAKAEENKENAKSNGNPKGKEEQGKLDGKQEAGHPSGDAP